MNNIEEQEAARRIDELESQLEDERNTSRHWLSTAEKIAGARDDAYEDCCALKMQVKALESRLAEARQQTGDCLNCGRRLPPDGDCYGCAADKAWADLAEANRDCERANMLAQDLIGQLQQRLKAAEASESRLREALLAVVTLRDGGLFHIFGDYSDGVRNEVRGPHWQWMIVDEALRPAAEQPGDSDAGLVWPRNEVRRVQAKPGETRIRPPFVISDDATRPAESERKE